VGTAYFAAVCFTAEDAKYAEKTKKLMWGFLAMEGDRRDAHLRVHRVLRGE
jgi:hypothetical protein